MSIHVEVGVAGMQDLKQRLSAGGKKAEASSEDDCNQVNEATDRVISDSEDMTHASELPDIGNTVDYELLGMLLAELPVDIGKIQAAYAEADMTLLKSLVHRLRGATCYVNVPRLGAVLKAFELALYSTDEPALKPYFLQLEAAVVSLLAGKYTK